MEKQKELHLEYYLGCFFICAFFYFTYNFYFQNKEYEFLNETKSRLLTLQNQKDRYFRAKIEKNFDIKKDPMNYFRACIQKAGFFKIMSLCRNGNYLVAKVEKNEQAQNVLSELLSEVIFEESDKFLVIRFPIVKEQKDFAYTKPEFKLDAIIFENENKWSVWINGLEYDQNKRNIDSSNKITNVGFDFVEIRSNNDLNVRIILNSI
jgi:hypothetical protein